MIETVEFAAVEIASGWNGARSKTKKQAVESVNGWNCCRKNSIGRNVQGKHELIAEKTFL